MYVVVFAFDFHLIGGYFNAGGWLALSVEDKHCAAQDE